MIPYLDIATFTIGGVRFYTFGLLVAIGAIVGHAVAGRRHQALKLGPAAQYDIFVLWLYGTGFFFSHVFDVLMYRPATVLHNPIELVMVHHGLSSFGGVAGACIGGLGYIRLKKLPAWPWIDLCTYAFPFAWLFGRAGCAVAHDHKGRLTDSWLAVRFPDGPRYDLGLIEFAFTPLLIALVMYVARRDRRPGMISGAFAVAYSLVRFPLDFLRATDLGAESDVRYFGLTPGQYASVFTLGLGAWMILAALDRAPLPPDPKPETA